ncbi:hypothetical protein SAMN02927914_05936 [Mesorhizobium qingshengii]|uniref:HdeA/HdeB family protein n=1 Tax=Mesorhizobium qingshengii TaxID=1165689 RepID=A0A1G5ZS59_9HYPH|nr:hypothetical protein SAMN02927914_05936 [Mesorhizobium qingshengii]
MIRLTTTFAMAGLLVLVPSAPQARPLNSSERAEFVRNFSPGCMTEPNVKTIIKTFGGGRRELRQYCDCVGSYSARKLTVEQLTNSNVVASRIAQAWDYCIKKVFPGCDRSSRHCLWDQD